MPRKKTKLSKALITRIAALDPPSNNVRKLREAAKLSQRDLAEKAGTSQQQVQRIEAGQQTGLNTASRIAFALGVEVAKAFPAAAAALNQLGGDTPRDHRVIELLAKSGIDADPRFYTFRAILRNGIEHVFNLSSSEYERIGRNVQDIRQDNEFPAFLMFESRARQYAINPAHLVACDLGEDSAPVTTSDEDDASVVRVHLAIMEKPLEYELPYADKDNVDPDYEGLGLTEIGQLFCDLDSGMTVHGTPAYRLISFKDSDGERAFIRVNDIAMLEADLRVCDLKFAEADEGYQAKLEGV
jgi:transcriptional regulator with XRE-family HTH domain